MKLTYIAGPYSGPTFTARQRNIDNAENAALWCESNGIAVICPHLNSAHHDDKLPDVLPEFWYAATLTMLERCDAILLTPLWELSKGSANERCVAEKLGLPMFHFNDHRSRQQLIEWARS